MVGVVEGFRWALLGTETAPGPMIVVSAIASVLLLVSASLSSVGWRGTLQMSSNVAVQAEALGKLYRIGSAFETAPHAARTDLSSRLVSRSPF
jgi:hypothetical protein